MTISYRGHTGQGTYFITASTYLKRNLLQTEPGHRENTCSMRFVIMSDHFHLLITPGHDTTPERALQLIKGGFSDRAKKDKSRFRFGRSTSAAEAGPPAGLLMQR